MAVQLLRRGFNMCKEIDNGKTRIVNKGVDVTVIASSNTIAQAMKASRTLVVKGISTAVIEVLTIEPLDKKTFLDFAEKTGVFIFTEQWLYKAITEQLLNHESIMIELVKEPTSQNIIDTTTDVIKRKLCK